MSGEVTLLAALGQIEDARNQTERNRGFDDLRNILAKTRGGVGQLKDGSVHRIYETLFQVAIDDRATYLKAASSTSRTAADNRLSACAVALQNAVKETIPLVRARTLRALIDHITQLFEKPNGRLCEPLALEYAKCLTALLSHQPHLEHLRPKERSDCVIFCLKHLESSYDGLGEDDVESGAERASIGRAHSYRSSRSLCNKSHGSQGNRSKERQVAEEMLESLVRLTASPSAAVDLQYGQIVEGLVGFLVAGTTNIKSQQDAFAIINHSLSWITVHDIALTRKNLSQLIRLLTMYWPPKVAADSLRDEMIITLVYLRPYVVSSFHSSNDSAFRRELESLLEVIRNEYGIRQLRAQLQIEDMRLQIPETDKSPSSTIQLGICSLRCADARSESNWMVLYMMATMCKLLSWALETDRSSGDEDGDASRRRAKRARLTSDFDDLLEMSVNGKVPSRVTALQTLMFLAEQQALLAHQLVQILDKLASSCADDRPEISSWAFLALAGIASQEGASKEALSKHWLSIWQLATRAMSNAITCRSASHLLYIMLRLRLVSSQTIAGFVHTMTLSIDLHGPPLIADSVAQLLKYTVRTSEQTNPTRSAATAESVLSWLFRTFRPSQFTDGAYAGHQSVFEPDDVTELVAGCLGNSFLATHRSAAHTQYPLWGRVAQSWLSFSAQLELVEYLLLLPSNAANTVRPTKLGNVPPGSATQSRPACEAIVLSNLSSELYRMLEVWKQVKMKDVTQDMFACFCKSSSVASSIALCCNLRDTRRRDQLQKQADDLLDRLVSYAKSPSCPQDKADAMLVIFSRAFVCLQESSSDPEPCACERSLCQATFDTVEARTSSIVPSGHSVDDDFMDMDDGFDSQASRRTERSSEAQELRNDLAVAFGGLALRANIFAYTAVRARGHTRPTEVLNGSEMARALDSIFSMPDAMIFAGRDVISRLSQLGMDVTVDDAARLAEFCCDRLGLYEFERNEVALGAILDIMASITSIWTLPANEQLYDDGLAVYTWYIQTGFPNGMLSSNNQRRLATLLLQLCYVDLDYGKDDNCPSARTSIFELVSKGSLAVQFYLAGRISAIFGLFVLSNHTIMFEDLREVLPKNTSHIEGIAVRLLFFSRLASAWHSLLRECVFYIVETAGEGKSAARFATHCILRLAQALDFNNPQKLFQLFAPQLLHSWLENAQSLSSLPFAVFQYDTLEDLIAQNLAEITAQLFVRGAHDEFDVVLDAVKLSKNDLLKRCLAKIEAYCISRDISRTGNEAERTLREAFNGKDQFNKHLLEQYPAILAQFFLSSQNDVNDQWLEKRNGYGEEAKALSQMKSYSHSDRALPACQQPSYKSKWLCDQIERLCRRVGKANPAQRWDASSFTFAARALLDSIDVALGPLHTCLVIRRLRLLICLAGDVAVVDYQIEMLIGALRPYLNDSQCADDTMGVLQYLFHRGQAYLSTQLPFLRGTVTLALLQMRKHSRARQESTTQESQHHATLNKMQKLYGWLIQYFKSCLPDKGSKSDSELVQSLEHAQLPGNALRETAESKLLLTLIENGQSSTELFRPVHRREALLMLSEGFAVPNSPDEDCLSEDADCVRMTDYLWHVSRLPGLGKEMIGWTAAALGRAYAASGERPTPRGHSKPHGAPTGYEGMAKSQAAIARRLVDALYGGTRHDASIADSTLRDALLSFDDANDLLAFESMLPPPLVQALQQGDHGYSPVLNPTLPPSEFPAMRQLRDPDNSISLETWIQKYSIALCFSAKRTPILSALVKALQTQPSFGLDVFPKIVHILLEAEVEKGSALRTELSACVAVHFAYSDEGLLCKQAYLLELLLYLRAQPMPGEHTQADRLRWLEVDWLQAAEAASRSKMPETALLFAESATTASATGSRRSSSRGNTMLPITIEQIPQDLLMSIFKGVDEPDSFYGVEQPASMDSVLERLDFEADGFRSLMFRSAQTDARFLHARPNTPEDSAGMMRSLSMLNLNSLTFALLSSSGANSHASSNELLNAARKLEQWDIAVPETSSGPVVSTFSVFQELNRTSSQDAMRKKLQSTLLDHVQQVETLSLPSREWFGALASMVEVGEVIGSLSQLAVRARWERMQTRQEWMHLARYEDISLLLTNRQILFSSLVQNGSLLRDMHGAVKDFRAIEIEALLNVASFARGHGEIQEALTAVRQAGNLALDCEETGLKVAAAVKLATAAVLWDSQEATASVRMMQDTLSMASLDEQDVDGPGRAGLLARLAHQLGEARMEKADSILSRYLEPAIKQLGNRSNGSEAGEVFYEFATFCDKQLQNPGSIEDFERIARLRQKKLEEVLELERLINAAKRRDQRESYYRDHRKATTWYDIDNEDYERLKRTRDTFMQQSLQNYMLALQATNKFDLSVLRLFALWLENADVPEANHVASKYLHGIPSWKFVQLMNQLMSRLESDGSVFQKTLSSLLFRICSDHPYHSLHHLFATTRKPPTGEQAADSRYRAASNIRAQLAKDSTKGKLLEGIFLANRMYVALAMEDPKRLGHVASINDLHSTAQMRRTIPNARVPPITLSIPLRPNGDYDNVPTITRFGSNVRIMSGISKPKSLQIHASDGQAYSQLFKSGNDDLRQDAIMEQVFEEVSKMLRNHKATRQRNLVVRTYKVIPLTSNAGVIEFVPNSLSFSDFLRPAHPRYFPQDWKESKAREMIGSVKDHSVETRITEYKKVCEHIHPVMRHFFLERFSDPEEWFQKRTAYTRTTATISILGYVLGLGDRHCQNIMLDEKTGEVVHIDLGVAFEAGRVLPVPELVPFRLSRDVVDGFGITKTEGVFRRCCEFTMDALRADKDSIMTLLNVLRYDPLYAWNVSPLRAKRMQEETGREQGGPSKKNESEAGEADRALSVVEKKLSKTLSTAATVNELIQQALDVKNLATLYSGWSAWY